MYIVIGTVGVIDNMFVFIVFILFIKIADKVNVFNPQSFKQLINKTGIRLEIAFKNLGF